MTTLAVYDCMLFFRAAARPRLARPLFDFVDLMESQSAAGIDFRNRFPGVQIVTPPAFEALIAKTRG